MGRRILFLMGPLLLLSCPPSHGQAQKTEGPAAQDPAAAALPPIPEPAASERPGAAAPGAVLPRTGDLPAGEPSPEARPAKTLVPPPHDDEVRLTEGAGDAPTPPPQAAPAPTAGAGVSDVASEGSGFVLPADRLPLGKQEVVLSVDVQAPTNINFNRETTFKIIVRNSGSTDALGVTVRDELPAGLAFVSSQPDAQKVGDSLLTWRISTLPAGSERIILLKAKPTKSDGALEHSATVAFLAGSKASSRILRPQLKLDVVQTPSDGKVLKNKTAEYRISVTNTGNGPARNVIVQAKLSPGLRHDAGERSEDNSFELPLQELAPGQREELDPLAVDAIQGGSQTCLVTATSSDVDYNKEAAQVERKLEVVEPKLKMTLTGPDKRYTDTVAPYAITLENPGTAAAKNVKVLATLGVSGRLVAVPPGAKYDSSSRRLQWTIPQLDPGEKPRTYPFEVRMGGISAYEVNVEARGDNAIYQKDRRITDVQGMPDVDLVVRERRRVVDLDGTTTFKIQLRNYGTKEATKLQVEARVSNNLTVDSTAGGPEGEAFAKDGVVKFPLIERLGPGKEMVLGIKVKVANTQSKVGSCRVTLVHDDLTEPLEDMATVKLTESRRAAITGP